MGNSQERIKLEDSTLDVFTKLSEGNPGALTVLMSVLENAPIVDPQAFGGGVITLLAFDTHGIYGSRIWMLYKDVCGQDIPNVIAVLRAMQLGFVRESEVDHAIDNRGAGLDVPDLLKQVMERLPEFNKQA